MERRSQSERDMTPSRENLNVFDDEFEVEEFDGIADGLRPGHNHDREGDWRQDQEEGPSWSVSAHYAPTSITPTPIGPSRNSTRKSRGHENPFASPEDDPEPLLQRTPSGNFTTRRSVSSASASSHHFAGTESPRFGAGGPSHPYSMYPQGTMARTPSGATASTVRPQRNSSARYRPQHPYAMYAQGLDDDLDGEHSTTQNPVPVGFLGLGQSFHRQRGPDGEEQDILGDFGHTEQLPPYSRYPDEGPEKAPLLDVPRSPSALHSRAPVLGTDPGMPLMHAHVQTAQQSMMDQSNLNRQPSTVSRASTLQNSVNSPQNSLKADSEKTWSEKSWKEKRKTRFCGIPCWWFLLAVGLSVFVVAIIGGVIGGFVEGQKKGHESALAAAASTSLYDASLIMTTTTTQPPATGTYALSLGAPQATQSACLHNPDQQVGWNCDLAGEAEISIIIDMPPGSDQFGAQLASDIINDTLLVYGTQRSNMESLFSPFLMVKDTDEPENGPAFYFQQRYNKLVVIPEDAIDKDAGKIKREIYNGTGSWTGLQAQPSDKPWFCYWNHTFVEGFIYPNKEAIAPPSSTSSAPSSTPPPASATTTTDNTASTKPATIPWSITWAAPTETVTTTLTMSSTTCSYEGVASGFPDWMHTKYPEWYNHQSEYDQQHEHGGPPERRKRNDDYNYNWSQNLPQYPYLVKIEERRVPRSPAPYCVKYQVLDSLHWNWVANDQGEQITITLKEEDPGYEDVEDAGEGDSRRKLRRRRSILGECHCQWQSGQG